MTDEHASWALHDGRRGWAADELATRVEQLAGLLLAQQVRVLATLLDNSPAWVVLDRACEAAGVVHVPLPAFFTPAQWQHAILSSGVDALVAPWQAAPGLMAALADPAATVAAAGTPMRIGVADEDLLLARLPARPATLPPGTAKITFTSGTTGAPKGVCLSQASMDRVAQGIGDAMEPLGIRRHLCALPLPVLLENVAGLMAPMSRGVTCHLLPLAEVGLRGSSSFDPSALHAAVERLSIESLILLPQMLRAWALWLAAGGRRAPRSLRFVAVGGAAVGTRTLLAARAAGLPAYEGYGLSEGGSVQTLNLPGADRPGSAGRALPHAALRIAGDGEIEVRGGGFLGYVGDDTAREDDWWPSGDLGAIDDDGFLHVRGRRKHVLITAYGRNVSPEWVETALRAEPAIGQAVVLGDGRPALSAVLWPLVDTLGDDALDAAVRAANATLPDYARIGHWVRARRPFDAAAGMATPNGRPRRDAIEHLHADALAPADA